LRTGGVLVCRPSEPGTVHVQGENGQSWRDGGGGGRSPDVGVVASANPGSDIVLYNNPGYRCFGFFRHPALDLPVALVTT
jgi:hypothetical protein